MPLHCLFPRRCPPHLRRLTRIVLLVCLTCLPGLYLAPRVASAQEPVPAPDLVALYDQAQAAADAGDLPKAQQLIVQVLARADRELGPEHKATMAVVYLACEIAVKRRDLGEARRMQTRLVAGTDKGGSAMLRANARLLLARTLHALGADEEAWPLVGEGLKLADEAKEGVLIMQLLMVATQVAVARGQDLLTALPYVERLVAMLGSPTAPPGLEALLPPILCHYARMLTIVGRADQAEQQIDRALALGPKEPRTREDRAQLVDTWTVRAQLRLARGDSATAQKAIRVVVGLTEGRPEFVESLAAARGVESSILSARGDGQGAVAAAREFVALLEKLPRQPHPSLHSALSRLSAAEATLHHYPEAIAAQSRAVGLLEQRLGAAHVLTVGAQTSLAQLLILADRPAEALPKLQACLKALATMPSFDSTFASEVHGTLAQAQERLGKPEAALAEVDQAVALRGTGPGAHDVDVDQARRSRLLLQLKRPAEAVAAIRLALSAEEFRLSAGLAAGSEQERRGLLTQLEPTTDWTVDLALKTGLPEAAVTAAETLMQRRGRLLEAMAGTLRGLQASLSPEDAALVRELNAERRHLAALIGQRLRDPSPEQLAALGASKRKLQQLESAASERPSGLPGSGPVQLAQVQATLPKGSALVEFVVIRPAELAQGALRRSAEPLLAVVVVRPGQTPRWHSLGPAEAIGDLARKWAERLRNPAALDVHEVGRALAAKVWTPLTDDLKGATQLLLVPDGGLERVPLGALPVGNDQFAVERWPMQLLASGRDVLGWKRAAGPRQPPTVLADPELGPGKLAQLPGARAEGEAVAKLLGAQAKLLTGPEATREVVEALHAPQVLHLATHGWFELGQSFDNPLAASGLALAGANQGKGRLTALEIASLDLHGTDLVTLSACETGLGVSYRGDGVYGLQRAIALAGARSVLMSLWTVDDEATRQLMTEFYRALMRGTGRGEALRAAQLGLLRARRAGASGGSGGRGAEAVGVKVGPEPGLADHPYWWAAFVLAGESGPLQVTKAPASSTPKGSR